jgi:SAM-dependent methyltransferase
MMVGLRYRSDYLRFKSIQKYIRGATVLDIGSSEGYLHSLLKKNNPDKRIFSLDDSKNADYSMNLDRPRKIKKKFDVVIAGEIIEHLESPIQFIRYCKNLLVPRGMLILTTPNAIGLQYLLNESWCVHYSDYRGHTQSFTLPMLKRIITDEKFDIISSSYINAFWQRNPLQIVSLIFKKFRPDLLVVAQKRH